ncbi:DUF6233 domain-containing protein [Streptomyces sp. NBC_01789]|uniref:DUF6233 domain-containing protein n=1 Tax=Streptomyces sp. NBC_01789 TaxID=2975941 RepID=UPI00225629E0|nr:DUF6233 domain-containing protein [Streptomyces sp. NBC_01789]MCX4451622.1 DUF6233 domain-containing protein [Streptomyces sp. NBC_01789]
MTSDLEKNRALEAWLEYQLRLTRERIRELTAREDQQLRARQRARAEQAWALQPGRSAAVSLLHRGGCTLYKGSHDGYLDRDAALAALAEPSVEPCGICRPETGLGEAVGRPADDGCEPCLSEPGLPARDRGGRGRSAPPRPRRGCPVSQHSRIAARTAFALRPGWRRVVSTPTRDGIRSVWASPI